jgi:hypothetical protein
LPVSDLEKTLIDIIYFKEHLSPFLLKKLRKKINSGKLKKYLKSYPKNFQEFVLKRITIQ